MLSTGTAGADRNDFVFVCPNFHGTNLGQLSLYLIVRISGLIFVFLLLSVGAFSQGQTRTKKQVSTKYYANGNVKSVAETWTTLPRYVDPMNFYKKTKVFVVEYDSITKGKQKEWTRIFKIGKDGKPCHELFYEEITYDQYGNRINYQCSRCDKRKAKYKHYKDGKVEFIQVVKHRKRQ